MQWQVEEKMEKVHGEPKQLMESNIVGLTVKLIDKTPFAKLLE